MTRLLTLAAVLMLTSNTILAKTPSRKPAVPGQDNSNRKPTTALPEDQIDVGKAFLDARIVPDVIDKPPPILLTAAYPTANISLGNEISPCRTVINPIISYEADSNKYYTFMLLDIDSPSRASPMLRSFVIALYVNIPGCTLKNGCSVCPYIPCTPEAGSAPHRYVLLVYEQRTKINVMVDDLLSLGVYRYRFSVYDFVAKYGLTNLIAGNYFISEIPRNYIEYCN